MPSESLIDIVNSTISPNIPQQVVDNTLYVSGFTLAITTFILGGIFLLLTISYVIFKVFGQPMSVAASDGSLIQHFDTPKSAVMKDAIITGGACRYKNLKDGTLAVTTKSIVSIQGKNAIITFSGLGISIPIPHLAAMTILTNQDIKLDLSRDEETGEYNYKLNKDIPYDTRVLEGYNFYNFKEILKQMNNKRYISLMVESVNNFITKNIDANYTERKIKDRAIIMQHNSIEGFKWDFIPAVIGVVLVVIAFSVTK